MLSSILDVPMKCPDCGAVTRAGDCEGDVDGDGSLGCPVPDCGGICVALVRAAQGEPHESKA